jgi:hypothetical protein
MTDGSVSCWGDNTFGQASAPTGTFTEVSAGSSTTCGIEGPKLAVTCWGERAPIQLVDGNFAEVSVGGEHSCALKGDGSVICWGDDVGAITILVDRFNDVSAGADYSCGLRMDGSVWCWGDNSFGQADPVPGTFSQVSAGTNITCGIWDSKLTITCWGQVVLLPGGSDFTQVSVGEDDDCALHADGTVYCWGADDSYGQLTPPPGSFTAVSSGFKHSCGVKVDERVACWGWNGDGQASPPARGFAQVSAGGFHSCGVELNGTVSCWGSNAEGQAAAPSGSFIQVSAGRLHSCGVRLEGSLSCWGQNVSGQASPPPGRFTRVSAGRSHTCAVRADHIVECWGTPTTTTFVPGNTPIGSNVTTTPVDASSGTTPVQVTFTDVTSPGATSLTTSETGQPPSDGFRLGEPPVYYEISTSAEFSGAVTICIVYDPAIFSTTVNLRLLHQDESGQWVDVTTSLDETTHTICGEVTSLSPFLVAQLDAQPPTLNLPADITVDATSPAGAPVEYVVTAEDNDEVSSLACLPPSGSTFPIGATIVNCAAADYAGHITTGDFHITVKGAEAEITDLIETVVALALPTGTTKTLQAKLGDALEDLRTGDGATACADLEEFIGRVQRSAKITTEAAAQLVTDATRIRGVLGC